MPILLRNPVLIRPFERLLRNYGLPQYGELEPTAIMAVTFLLYSFFGGLIASANPISGLSAGSGFVTVPPSAPRCPTARIAIRENWRSTFMMFLAG